MRRTSSKPTAEREADSAVGGDGSCCDLGQSTPVIPESATHDVRTRKAIGGDDDDEEEEEEEET